jgi:hypothetical protein
MTSAQPTAHDDESGHPRAMTAGDHHDTAAHGDVGAHDDHAHAGGDALGPIDVYAWGAALLGVGLGGLVALAFWLATRPTTV